MKDQTPGPWHQVTHPHGWDVVGGPNETYPHTVAQDIKYEADAKLIAAAPNLYASLEKLVKLAYEYCPGGIFAPMPTSEPLQTEIDATIEEAFNALKAAI